MQLFEELSTEISDQGAQISEKSNAFWRFPDFARLSSCSESTQISKTHSWNDTERKTEEPGARLAPVTTVQQKSFFLSDQEWIRSSAVTARRKASWAVTLLFEH